METLLLVVTERMLSLIDVTIDNDMLDKRILGVLQHMRTTSMADGAIQHE
jgi:hypothetical protein